jgi:anaerobic ribonucleoside-triphosphate reductase activating protein
MNWQLNRIHYPIYNLGEGRRIGIWVQGCNLVCEGCVSQTLWNKKGGDSISLLEIFNWVYSKRNEFDGITITGGEPFQQYEQLITFLHLIKTKTKLNIQCFSGYYLQELKDIYPDLLFLKYIDVLVDGRYIKEQHDDANLIGSSNQTIYNIVENQVSVSKVISTSKKISLLIDKESQIYMTGIPRKGELDSLCEDLLEVGFCKSFK